MVQACSSNHYIGSSVNLLFYGYDTPKMVRFDSKWIGLLNRAMQVGVLVFIIGYVLMYSKGYQVSSNVVSAVTCKVEGSLTTNFEADELDGVAPEHVGLYNRNWDVEDLVTPPDAEGFFLTTNMIITPNQSRTVCNNPWDKCYAHADCLEGKMSSHGDSQYNGTCDLTSNTCFVKAWCPVEFEHVPRSHGPIFEGVKHFSVLIYNQVGFPLFDEGTTNTRKMMDKAFLRSCRYSKEHDPLCPIFDIDYIVESAGANWTAIAMYGGVISIGIAWDCDLDKLHVQECFPKYEFHRLDNHEASEGQGWNVRYTQNYEDETRDMFNAYGIRFVVHVWGKAGRFHIKPLLLNVGAGLGLLGFCNVFCNALLFIFNRKFYRNQRFEEANAPDAFRVCNSYNSIESLNEINMGGDPQAANVDETSALLGEVAASIAANRDSDTDSESRFDVHVDGTNKRRSKLEKQN